MAKKTTSGGLVYSTDHGKICPECSQPIAACTCKQTQPTPARDGIVRVGRETKGRKGKGVTVITGVPLDASGLAKLSKQLKQKCGTGGTVKDGVIELQGEHRDTAVEALQQHGWTVKRAGG